VKRWLASPSNNALLLIGNEISIEFLIHPSPFSPRQAAVRGKYFPVAGTPLKPLYLKEVWAADNQARKAIATERGVVAG
jgi:hypothetical protein